MDLNNNDLTLYYLQKKNGAYKDYPEWVKSEGYQNSDEFIQATLHQSSKIKNKVAKIMKLKLVALIRYLLILLEQEEEQEGEYASLLSASRHR